MGRGARPAGSVGAGILLSRVTGVARDVALAAFLGTGRPADAYWAALKIPNIVRNLLGEGTLSASFVPVYASSLAAREAGSEEPARLARSVLGGVLLAAGLLAGLGVLLAPWITGVLLAGADEATRVLATSLVRILFPMAGILVVGAWFLGVLNTHDRFFLPFAAPALWNLAQVTGLFVAAHLGAERIAVALAWSALGGALLQVGVQAPVAFRLSGVRRPGFEWSLEPVRRVARNSLPVISSQGILQVSSLVDVALAALAGPGALAALGYSQRLAYLPISLFGISIAAAALPAMSREARREALAERLRLAWFQILFFVLPSAVALLLFGDLLVSVVYERGEFGRESTALVTLLLAAYGLGLAAASSVKLFASGFHAMQDTASPLRAAGIAVAVAVTVGAALTLLLRASGFGAFAAVGIVLGGALGSWVNLLLLWAGLRRRLGPFLGRDALRAVLRLAVAVLVATAAGWAARTLVEPVLPDRSLVHRGLLTTVVLSAFGLVYLAIARRPPRPAAPSHDAAG
ncbi:MAG: murein biosynthesis integral membrane protein MurJ [Gemmatimonadota bacterium]|nr:murein biosynthesis integral membrane protein MurJ [Gemmatimonadota bacterium]